MKCVIPGQNVKILARALHSLARVGDELFVDPLDNGISLCTVNSSQSAFAEFVFLQSFFSSYAIGVESVDALPKCKILMRSPHSMDKMVDWCQLRLEPDGVQLIFQVKFTGGSTKTYFLPIIECETLQVKFKKSDATKLVATSKLLSGVVKNFRLNEDEITLIINKQRTTFRNHIDSTTEKNKTVRTELGLLAGEFEMYSVSESVSVTFCLKQLRAILFFAEPTGLPITIYFDTPGRPVIFSVHNESAYEANFVVSSLQSAGDSQSQRTQKSDIFAGSNGQAHSIKECNLVKSSEFNKSAVPSCSKNNKKMSDTSEFETANVVPPTSQNVSRKRPRESDEFSSICNNIFVNNNNCNVVINSSTQDTVLIENNELDMYDNIPNSPQNSPKLILSNIFGRCFNSTFQKNTLPGFSNVIAYDSDGLEDSD